MKTTTAERDPKALAKLRELIEDIHVAMITTVTPDGALRSRPMATQHVHAEQGELWFFTADDSGKARDIAEEHAVNVSYADPKRQRYVSVTGSANLLHDREKAKELWHAELKAWFPKGLDDPRLSLLRVRVVSAEYWDLSSGRMVHLLGRAMSALGGHPENDEREPEGPGSEHTKIGIRATPASG